MDKKGKLLLTGLLVLIIFLLVAAFWLSQKVVGLEATVNKIAIETSSFVQPKNGKDGYTPQKGIDYNDGKDGAPGINSISFSKTVIEQVPIVGAQGNPGNTPPTQQIQLDPVTGDLETKYSNTDFWTVLIPCAQLLVSCPDVSVVVPIQTNGGLSVSQ